MKRLHMLSANFAIDYLERSGDMKGANKLSEIMLDFMKYCWKHKEDDNLYALALPKKSLKLQK